MPKSHKRKKNPGVGIDFKRAKHKVGKKLPKAQNETDTTVRASRLVLAEQSVAVDKSGVATTSRNVSLKVRGAYLQHWLVCIMRDVWLTDRGICRNCWVNAGIIVKRYA